mmetsp:Transcript_772/g.2787  ORF Transcript_772/g.2787 Transcript_772/m.2787 type:complete len:244 (-) Transcript_772:257-988(-)|eukprot:CAMPEP_0114627926 /NCGR_PEP_ID=MMETSP0168-20121206/12552_1 /TAXON_ID=95228 ORGANISM="Vannella sp., Strain DIVA3 517/6/12" /NCGR_SAMPLE_ID=MMETSP0168 /ASSEMBLY_ACC=CAM_ASM_000044 /LENGTH=243 /DNA_ID=CAMNT_0001839283 /DNA_START=96 /DNA_END=827 /DNA_ORIENTATION=-
MFKLVDFLQKKKKEGGGKESTRKKSGSSSTLPRPEPALKLNPREKQEIRATLRGFQGSEAHDILMKQLAEHDIVNEIVAEEVEDDSSYSSGTFCVRSLDGGEEEEEEEQNYGTFCVNTFSNGSGASEEAEKPSFLSHSTPGASSSSSSPSGTPKKSKSKRKGSSGSSGSDVAASNSAPDFSNMFREPEDWEKCILSLEKGEWTDQMESKGAFKRWKKERPAMPSAYLKSSPLSGDMFAPPGGK